MSHAKKNPTECLKDEALRRKCPSATQRDDLEKHTSTHHEGKTPKEIGDEKLLKIRGFFATVSPPPLPLPTPLQELPQPPPPPPPLPTPLQELPQPPSTDESAIHSESSEPSGSKDVQTQPPTDASNIFMTTVISYAKLVRLI